MTEDQQLKISPVKVKLSQLTKAKVCLRPPRYVTFETINTTSYICKTLSALNVIFVLFKFKVS